MSCLILFVERRHVVDLVHRAIDADALETLGAELGEFFFVFALAAARDRGEQVKLRAFLHRHDAIDDLASRLALDRQAGRGRIGNADPGPEQAHIVVDFGHGRDRRTRILRGRLLFD